jgi:acyl-CoA reductase-like NAD-dependent aldehyde dehydrogenase
MSIPEPNLSIYDMITRLRATAIDARARNARYRQSQLLLLHRFLSEEAESICSALTQSQTSTLCEAEFELYVTLKAVRQLYESLSVEGDLHREYSVVRNIDNLERRAPHGIVLIRPTTSHTPLYAVISPLAAAISAGNCVCAEVRLLSTKILMIILIDIPSYPCSHALCSPC